MAMKVLVKAAATSSIPFGRLHSFLLQRPDRGGGINSRQEQPQHRLMKTKPTRAKPPGPTSTSAKRKLRLEKVTKAGKGRVVDVTALDHMKQINFHAAGIDLGAAENFVCVPATSSALGESPVRAFGVFTEEMDALVEWLRVCQVTSVAMEATGIYWMVLYDKLEAAGMEVVLVEPGSVKSVDGRKSDVLDCQWLQKLHTYGLLSRSFRPDAPVRRLRTLTRHRAILVECGTDHLRRIEKALVQMNLQLNLVVSDINGETGLRILDAIVNGQRDPKELVKLRDPRCRKSTVAEMEAALTGHYTVDLMFLVEQNLAGWRFFQKQMEGCDREIEKALAHIPTAKVENIPPPPPKAVPAASAEEQAAHAKRKKKSAANRGNNALTLDAVSLCQQLQRICGVNLMNVCGLNLLSVLMIIAEVGTDMSRWRSAKAFCSWLGLCPGTKISGGRILSRRSRRVVNRASTILRMAALVVGRTDSWLGRFYRRKKAHLGAPKAITATARKLACVIYHMLKYRDEFVPLDVMVYETKAAEHRLRKLRRDAQAMGLELVKKEHAA